MPSYWTAWYDHASDLQSLAPLNYGQWLDEPQLLVQRPLNVPNFFHKRQPQLSIIPEGHPLSMEPQQWQYLARPEIPFHFITNSHLRQKMQKAPARPWMVKQRKVPTDYYIEQMEFLSCLAAPLPEPIAEEPMDGATVPGPLKVWVLFLWALAITLGCRVLLLLTALFASLKKLGAVLGRKVVEVKECILWEGVLAYVTAGVLSWVWMRMEGNGGGIVEVATAPTANMPVYVINMRNPNQVYMGGAVMGGCGC